MLFLLAFSILVIFKNPLLEKRNALGVIYLMIIYFTIPKLFSSNLRSFAFLSLSLLIVFPLLFYACISVNNNLLGPEIGQKAYFSVRKMTTKGIHMWYPKCLKMA